MLVEEFEKVLEVVCVKENATIQRQHPIHVTHSLQESINFVRARHKPKQQIKIFGFVMGKFIEC